LRFVWSVVKNFSFLFYTVWVLSRHFSLFLLFFFRLTLMPQLTQIRIKRKKERREGQHRTHVVKSNCGYGVFLLLVFFLFYVIRCCCRASLIDILQLTKNRSFTYSLCYDVLGKFFVYLQYFHNWIIDSYNDDTQWIILSFSLQTNKRSVL
jgi:hypothetical protein